MVQARHLVFRLLLEAIGVFLTREARGDIHKGEYNCEVMESIFDDRSERERRGQLGVGNALRLNRGAMGGRAAHHQRGEVNGKVGRVDAVREGLQVPMDRQLVRPGIKEFHNVVLGSGSPRRTSVPGGVVILSTGGRCIADSGRSVLNGRQQIA